MVALLRRITTNSASIFGCNGIPNSPSSSLFSRRGIASRLFVGGLSFFTTEKTLAEAFSQYGQVIQTNIVHDRVSDRSKGFGFVTYASEDEADSLDRDEWKTSTWAHYLCGLCKAETQFS